MSAQSLQTERKTSERNNEKNMSAGYSGNGAVSEAVG